MKKPLSAVFVSGLLLLGVVACGTDTARTSGEAPNIPTGGNVERPEQETVRNDLQDATSDVRRNQLDADIRAREERNNIATGGDLNRTASAIASEVRSKLEANIPNGQLTVEATDDGAVTVAGTVPYSDQLPKIDRLAREIKGVRSVNVEAIVAPPQG
ncbi:MAG: BON domain-containing protein [Snowella sp.]|nr:BON domain-containing protein [Snowella sp.]